MRSAASVHGHPIHPILVAFPIAYLTGAFATASAGALLGRPRLTRLSRELVPMGIGSGLAAAVPGLIDYTYSVPPASSAKGRATTHALLNSAGLLLFAAGWTVGRGRRAGAALALQGLGLAALMRAGWLGGTLVYRNQIGVDHRQPDAGYSREVTATARGRVPAPDDDDQMTLVHASDTRVVVARSEGEVVAFHDRCTHRGGPLSDGMLACGIVQCPWHGSRFDVRSGAVRRGPATQSLRTVAARQDGAEVVLDVPALASGGDAAHEDPPAGQR